MAKALDFLREKGLATASKRSGRQASEGVIELYTHGNGRVGVMVEVNCESDFVGRSESFRELAHEIALQIAATSPDYITEADIPASVIEHETMIATAKAKEEGKPDSVLPRIIEGSIKKFKDEFVLMNQAYIRDEAITVQELMNQKIAAIGENIIVRRFQRWALGETTAEKEEE
jgi:elongation factor Ts